ncbi:BspA family leucine-rich repeat surface protein [Gordonibacter urolithinfaciens]|uniref:BspA family leucine-rich repeat surface protein n=1 Tax=Gordonibacter urolithinfaciens TaxID=1335613 RepID=A0A7K0I9B0_9ACTN|nr:BspA family leucine-rich repeat surface protein [Gordonibacter urolithinfaciens]
MPAIGLPSAIRTACMFRGCRSLTSLDMAGYDLHSAVDLHHMFSECWKLEQVGASTWNIPRASDVNKMFFDCQNLHEDLRHWQLTHLILADGFSLNSPGILVPDGIDNASIRRDR